MFLFPYVERGKPYIRANDAASGIFTWQSDVPYGFILRTILVDIFLNGLLSRLFMPDLYNFVGANRTSIIWKTTDKIKSTFEYEAEEVKRCFRKKGRILKQVTLN